MDRTHPDLTEYVPALSEEMKAQGAVYLGYGHPRNRVVGPKFRGWIKTSSSRPWEGPMSYFVGDNPAWAYAMHPRTPNYGWVLDYWRGESWVEDYSEDLTDLTAVAPPPGNLTTLPTDSAERKEYPLYEGLLRYFPAALAGVAKHSKEGNDKHNPGEPMHHARGKSGDHEDCILRHLMDLADLSEQAVSTEALLDEVNAIAWRALALSQALHEEHGAPMAPGASEE